MIFARMDGESEVTGFGSEVAMAGPTCAQTFVKAVVQFSDKEQDMLDDYDDAPRFRQGDHLKVKREFYWHHGIYAGNGLVFHRSGPSGQKRDCEVRMSPIEDFAQGGHVEVVPYAQGEALDPQDVLQKAWEQLGDKDYDLLVKNCEHFASECKTGKPRSRQVRAAVGGLFGVALAVGLGIWVARQ